MSRSQHVIVGLAFAASLSACGASQSAVEPDVAVAPVPLVDKPSSDPAIVAIDAALAQAQSSGALSTAQDGWRTHMPTPPTTIEPTPGATYDWVLETDLGTMRFRLRSDTAPKHVVSTMWLTRAGFYDGLTFHRVMQQFMAQGGCPLGTGAGSPGYRYSGEFAPSARHDARGTLSMANAGPNTEGSQFFITFGPTPMLDGKHTVFGTLVEGGDVLAQIEAIGTPPHTEGKPSRIVKILHAAIAVK